MRWRLSREGGWSDSEADCGGTGVKTLVPRCDRAPPEFVAIRERAEVVDGRRVAAHDAVRPSPTTLVDGGPPCLTPSTPVSTRVAADWSYPRASPVSVFGTADAQFVDPPSSAAVASTVKTTNRRVNDIPGIVIVSVRRRTPGVGTRDSSQGAETRCPYYAKASRQQSSGCATPRR